MNGYIEGGYLVTLLTLGSYGATLRYREHLAKARQPHHDDEPQPESELR